MTTSESITVSLEWAKKLKASGWPQESWAHYRKNREDADEWFFFGFGDEYEQPKQRYDWDAWLAAPTAEEILRRLPDNYQVWKHGGQWQCDYGLDQTVWMKDFDSAANAAAAMYCHLAENKLLPS